MILNIPTLITWLRIALIPLIVVVFYLPVSWAGPASAGIFALAGVTDWLDGYLARRLGQTSRFGAFLDPVADKLMVAAALVLVVDRMGGIVVAAAAIVIIGREIAISALREWMAQIGQQRKVAVSSMGKLKTTAQMVAIFLLLYEQPVAGMPVVTLGLVLLYVAAALTLWSMIQYLRAALRRVEEV
ncbi:CDP-diacylglycerol--glycerol-3-phosphate 3-phosphatidyltransferase [Thioalkalivibrio thiocyanodenitrificans]|uniref:CDP-diacylglycerol--glycerol-3-phosphate 3-phosphatidyltransferase n=1 Tax=Thioalkalivibrio thiocyanodenitrificans TaxID=243063 RepID=UPI000375AB3B|nr:CDP-diacylglycerol--glycerol-3-phosphate 3-phosphatidyltransferase [Thioalkalivibrio thiocyanodenitrificans]